MIDFLKAFPFVTKEEYMWHWTVPQIKLASLDSTHVHYLSEAQVEMRKAKQYNGNDLKSLSNVGIPIFGNNEN